MRRKHVVDIWKSHKNYLAKKPGLFKHHRIADYLAKAFGGGPHYYYVLDSPTLTFDLVSATTRELLGMDPSDFSIERFVDLIHPDDVEFFLRCEDVVAHFLKRCISPEQMTRYKINYCLRQRAADGTYRLFLMQTLTLSTTKDGELLKVFGAHSDISHITSVNNKRLSLIGLDGEPSFFEIDVFDDHPAIGDFTPYDGEDEVCPYTRREREIVKLLSCGLSTEEIAEQLIISSQTVLTHRKNLLRKTGARNTAELVAESVRKGFV